MQLLRVAIYGKYDKKKNGKRMKSMSVNTAGTLGLVASIVLIILLYVKVLPRKMDGKIENKFLNWLHNYFYFKRFYIEDILRFVFIVTSVLSF